MAARRRATTTVPWLDAPVAEQIRAEMVANVLSVLVSVGDAVDAGQPVVIMESMKMEIPVLAEHGGTVNHGLRVGGRRRPRGRRHGRAG